ncbi:hypothetical protein WJX72_004128 [[Myrmecia] bisecta]|uniref:Uncharacterized protein n=1 Tax=[Myrmecia] bisecta TaxID=41462 RepID=A0AAW1Q8P5_9CHLO
MQGNLKFLVPMLADDELLPEGPEGAARAAAHFPDLTEVTCLNEARVVHLVPDMLQHLTDPKSGKLSEQDAWQHAAQLLGDTFRPVDMGGMAVSYGVVPKAGAMVSPTMEAHTCSTLRGSSGAAVGGYAALT